MGLGPRGEGPETWEKPPRFDSRGSPGTPALAPLACRRARLLDPGCRCFPWAVGARAAPLHLSHSQRAREAQDTQRGQPGPQLYNTAARPNYFLLLVLFGKVQWRLLSTRQAFPGTTESEGVPSA